MKGGPNVFHGGYLVIYDISRSALGGLKTLMERGVFVKHTERLHRAPKAEHTEDLKNYAEEGMV